MFFILRETTCMYGEGLSIVYVARHWLYGEGHYVFYVMPLACSPSTRDILVGIVLRMMWRNTITHAMLSTKGRMAQFGGSLTIGYLQLLHRIKNMEIFGRCLPPLPYGVYGQQGVPGYFQHINALQLNRLS